MKIAENGCDCTTAVLRTFSDLRKRNMSETAALDSAATEFRFHHPEVPEVDAFKTADEWIDA
ncbi:MAG: hypothetical protein ACKVH1_06125 [Alphaproteobacteria bacterium]